MALTQSQIQNLYNQGYSNLQISELQAGVPIERVGAPNPVSQSAPTSGYNPYSSTSSGSVSSSGGAPSSRGTPPSTSNPLSAAPPSSGAGSPTNMPSAQPFPFSVSPVANSGVNSNIFTSPMGPGPGGSASMGANYNPSSGVSAGTFSATQQPYQYGGKPQSDVSAQTQMNVLGRGNPFQNIAQGYANTAGYNSANVGGAAIGQGQNQYSGANAVMNTAFDPQQELYKDTLQKVIDQNNAQQAARGVTMSPYGAGAMSDALSTFNTDWQNAQLTRQVQGLNAAGQANTIGANLGSTGVTNINNAGQLPYEIGQQALSNEQQSIQDWLNYLAGGTSASAGNIYTPPTTPTITFTGNMSPYGNNMPYTLA